MIKGVFFDLDGTLIKSMHFHYIGWSKILQDQGIKLNKKEFYLNEGTKLQNLLRKIYLQNNRNISDLLVKKLIKKKINIILKIIDLFFTQEY